MDSKQLSSTTSSDEKKVKEVKISNSHAPWMRIAIREGIEWKGKDETKIEDNYFALSGLTKHKKLSNYKSIVGDSNAWCAAFVNYCLLESGYNTAELQSNMVIYDLVRANVFKLDTVNFVEVNKPIYGVISLTFKNGSLKSSHAAFVLAMKDEKNFYRLGGNQKDQISITPAPIDGVVNKNHYQHRFFIPKKYYNVAKNQSIAPVRSDDQMKSLKITFVSDSHATR